MTITIPACQTSNQTIDLNGKTRKMNMQLLKQWNPKVPYISCVSIQAVSCLRWALEDASHLAAANLNCFVSRCSQEGYRPGQQERRVHLSVLPYFTEWPWHVPALLWTMKVWSRDNIVGPCHFSCRVSQSHCWVWLAGSLTHLCVKSSYMPSMTWNGRCRDFLLFFGQLQEIWNEKATDRASSPGSFLSVICLPSLFPFLHHLPPPHSPLTTYCPSQNWMQRTR